MQRKQLNTGQISSWIFFSFWEPFDMNFRQHRPFWFLVFMRLMLLMRLILILLIILINFKKTKRYSLF